MSPKARLTVAVIVKNDATGLQRTLQSVAGHPVRSLVFDTGSQDNTREVAQQMGAQVVAAEWHDSFSFARNSCARLVSTDWILWLDAGEVIDDLSVVCELVSSSPSPKTAYMMLVEIPPAQGELFGEQVAQIRLVPNDSNLRFVGRVAESLDESLMQAEYTVDAIAARIQRSACENDTAQRLRNAKRDIVLAKAELSETPKGEAPSPKVLNRLGEALSSVGMNSQAIACFRKCVEVAPPESSQLRAAFYGWLCALDAPDKSREQLTVCNEALQHFPLDAQILCVTGSTLQAQGELGMAMRSFRSAYEYGQIDPRVLHSAKVHEVALNCYVLTSQLHNATEEAMTFLNQRAEEHPDDITLARVRLQVLVKTCRAEEAVAVLPQLYPPQEQAIMSDVVRGACLVAAESWDEAAPLLTGAFQNGCRDVICLRTLTMTSIARGEFEVASQVIGEWKRLEPRSAEWRPYEESIERLMLDPRKIRLDGAQPIIAPTTTDVPIQPRSSVE